ncbi:MAG: hypothetical protein JOZ18_20485 [Chloroflexi bacterium]|nr:hypothetical protein [Chloroflexota bacterium]
MVSLACAMGKQRFDKLILHQLRWRANLKSNPHHRTMVKISLFYEYAETYNGHLGAESRR